MLRFPCICSDIPRGKKTTENKMKQLITPFSHLHGPKAFPSLPVAHVPFDAGQSGRMAGWLL